MLSVDEEVQGVLLGQFYSLSDDVVEVIGRQIVGNEVPTQSGVARQVSTGSQRAHLGLNTYLVLSISGSLEVSDFSQMTGILSGYLSLMRSASLFLWS